MFSKKSNKWIIGFLIFGILLGSLVVIQKHFQDKDEIKSYVNWYSLYVNQISEFNSKKYALNQEGDDSKIKGFYKDALNLNQKLLTTCQNYKIPQKKDILNNYNNILKLSQLDSQSYNSYLEYLKTKDTVFLVNAAKALQESVTLTNQVSQELQMISVKYLQ